MVKLKLPVTLSAAGLNWRELTYHTLFTKHTVEDSCRNVKIMTLKLCRQMMLSTDISIGWLQFRFRIRNYCLRLSPLYDATFNLRFRLIFRDFITFSLNSYKKQSRYQA